MLSGATVALVVGKTASKVRVVDAAAHMSTATSSPSGQNPSRHLALIAVALVVGKTASKVRVEDAAAYIAGYALANEVSLPEESFYRPAIKISVMIVRLSTLSTATSSPSGQNPSRHLALIAGR